MQPVRSRSHSSHSSGKQIVDPQDLLGGTDPQADSTRGNFNSVEAELRMQNEVDEASRGLFTESIEEKSLRAQLKSSQSEVVCWKNMYDSEVQSLQKRN